MNRIISLLAVLLILGSVPANAQEQDAGGSPYSLFGIGDIINYSSNRTYSMGILGTSLFGNYVNSYNPASLGKLRLTQLTFAFDYGFFNTQNATTESKLSNGTVLGFNLGIPLSVANGWTWSLGFNPVTIVNTKVKLNGSTGGQSFTQTYSSKGGLSRISTGMSYTLARALTLGAEYNYGFGEIKSQNFISFNAQGFINTNIKKELDFDKSYTKFGAILEPGRLFRSIPLRNLTIGFLYQFGFGLNSSEQGIYNSSLSIDTISLGSGEIEIPYQMSFGITNVFSNKYVTSADIVLQNWSNFKQSSALDVKLGSSYRAGLGIEILPSSEPSGLFETMSYRIGGYYEKLFYNVAGNDINSWGVRAGANIPLSDFSSLELGVNYSQRGTTSNGLVKDQFLNFTASVNFGEIWFIRPREEDQ